MTRLDRIKASLREHVLIVPDKSLTQALLGIDCDASVIDLDAGKCYCITTPIAKERGRCVEITYTRAPITAPHVVGSVLDALVAVSKSVRDKSLAIASTDLSIAIEQLLSAKLTRVSIDLLNEILKPQRDEDALSALREAERAVKVLTKVLRGSIDPHIASNCFIHIDSDCIEAFCSNGYMGGFVAITPDTRVATELAKILPTAIRSGLRDLDLSTLSLSLHSFLEKAKYDLMHLDYLRLHPQGLTTYYDSEKIEPPEVLGVKMYVRKDSSGACIGFTIAVLSNGEVRTVVPQIAQEVHGHE